MSRDITQLEWLDGPGFVAWLYEVRPELAPPETPDTRSGHCGMQHVLGHSMARRISDWKRGGCASLYLADAACVKLGLHISEIPDELWIERPARKPSRKRRAGRSAPQMREVRAQALRLLADGVPAAQVAVQLDVTTQTVRNWRARSRAGDGAFRGLVRDGSDWVREAA